MAGVSFQALAMATSAAEQTVTWNPADKASNVVLANGDLDMSCNTAAFGGARATLSRSAGKFYFEIGILSTGGSSRAGVADINAGLTSLLGASSAGIGCNGLAVLNVSGVGWAEVGVDGSQTDAAGNVMMFAIDIGAGNFWLGQNGTWRNSGDPGAGINPSATLPAGSTVYPAASSYSPGNTYRLHTKTAQLTYTIPSGFSAWAAA